MSTTDLKVAFQYLLAAGAAALLAGGGVLVTQLAGTDPINWRPILAAALGAILPLIAATQIPRVGSTQIAAQVDHLKAQGVHKRDMVVVPAATVETALSSDPLTPAQVDQLTTALLARAGKG